MATTMLPTSVSAVQTPGILTVKDIQKKNGIGPWMTRVRIVWMWHESDFMRTNDVTSLDLLLLDDTGDLLHAIVQKKFIWKFEPLLKEGIWNTDITPLETTSASIPRHKFNFTELENLAAATTNTYLTDVVGVLTSHTNLQHVKRSPSSACFMRELKLENLNGMKLNVTLWGNSTSELTRNLEAHELNPHPVVAGVYVKQYLGKASLSSTNTTKIFFDLDILEVFPLNIAARNHNPGESWLQSGSQSIGDTRMSISQLLETKWESGYNILNRKVCRAKAIGISTEKGWYFLGCHNCTTKLVGNKGDHWCPSYKVQIDELVPIYLLSLEVEDSLGTALFVAMDSKAAFESLIGAFQDYLILITPYNMKYLETPSFTVAKLPLPPLAPTPTISA
ncbi:hypothetical protein C5167_017541 [Papaver somniferum]|uniref:Uncharacterized protein n=1 Tax=Papaver somniferum TaxID=3469 RepID=A0A4Y7IK86_PAPSO|nr:hypothetical protein C5167_017541 [Papaver somniferum]